MMHNATAFLLPFIIAGLTITHLTFLQQSGSNNPLSISADCDKIPSHPYFSLKDIFGFMLIFLPLINLALFFPNLSGDPENFTPAKPLTVAQPIPEQRSAPRPVPQVYILSMMPYVVKHPLTSCPGCPLALSRASPASWMKSL